MERRSSEELGQKISQLLDTLVAWEVDLVVIPEYCFPPAHTDMLLGYAKNIAMVVGIGQLREEDASVLRDHGFSGMVVGTNSAIVIDDKQRLVVSKRNPSPYERMDVQGGGLTQLTLDIRGKSLRVAVAICMDYVIAGANLGGLAAEVDAIAVPAWSPSWHEFLDQLPRDAPMIFSNAALAAAASTIAAPGLRKGTLTERNVVSPIDQSGHEGVVVVDYDGPISLPTPTQPTRTKLFARAAICYDGFGAIGDDSGVVAEIQRWNLDRYREGKYNARLREMVESVGHPVLLQALSELATARTGNPLSAEDFDVMRRQIILRNATNYLESSYLGFGELVAAMQDAIVDSEFPDLAGTLLRASRDAQKKLAGYVRQENRSAEDNYAPVELKGQPDADTISDIGGSPVVLAAMRLTSFKNEDAVLTFPAQLAVLNSLLGSNDPRLTLQYTLRSESSDRQDPGGYFDVHLLGHGISEAEAEGVSDNLGQLVGVALGPGWNLGVAPRPIDRVENERSIYLRLVPQEGKEPEPAIAEDWGLILDFLRTQRQNVALRLSVSPRISAGDPPAAVVLREGLVDDLDESLIQEMQEMGGFARAMRDAQASNTGFVSDVDRRAAGFLWRVALSQRESRGRLLLRVELIGKGVTNQLAYSIGALIFGGAAFEILEGDVLDSGSLLTSEDALRVFHPPYQVISGRGLPNRRKTNLAYAGSSPVPSSGVILGTVRVPGPRHDSQVPFRLPDEVRLRHTYIVGRTGSGKTNLLKNLLRQDIDDGRSVVVLDPHGSLSEYCARHADQAGTTFGYLDFGATAGFVPNINPFSLDIDDGINTVNTAIDEVTEIIRGLSFSQFTGPRFQSMMSLVLRSLAASSSFELDLSTAFEILQSSERRNRLASSLQGTELADEWQSLLRHRAPELEELISWASSKLSVFNRDVRVRDVVGKGIANVSLSRFVARSSSERTCLAVRIPEWSLGTVGTAFLGRLIVSRIRNAHFGREVAEGELVTSLFVDEFQKFASADFETFLAESRKFGVALTLANQNLAQLSTYSEFEGSASGRLESAVMGNVGTMVAFGVGAADRSRLSLELDTTESAMADIAPFQAIGRVSGAEIQTGPFTLRIPDSRGNPGSPASIIAGINQAAQSTSGSAASDTTDGGVQPSSPVEDVLQEGQGEISRGDLTQQEAADDEPEEAGAYQDGEELSMEEVALAILEERSEVEVPSTVDPIVREFVVAASVSAVPEWVLRGLESVSSLPELWSKTVEELLELKLGMQLSQRIYLMSALEAELGSLPGSLESEGVGSALLDVVHRNQGSWVLADELHREDLTEDVSDRDWGVLRMVLARDPRLATLRVFLWND